jgi:AcrR family transcriptional regulator
MAGAKTRKIAELAGISERLLFKYFVNKTQLFRISIVDPFYNKINELHAELDAMTPDIRERNLYGAQETYLFLNKNSDLLKALIKSSEIGREIGHSLSDLLSSSADRIREQHVNSHTVPAIEPGQAVRYAFAMVAGSVLLHDWLYPDSEVGTQDDMASVTTIIHKMLHPNLS